MIRKSRYADQLSHDRQLGKSGGVRRVYILGGTGSGKTTLAARLAPVLGVEPVGLDDYRYTSAGKRTDRDVLTAMAARLADQKSWLAEGIYITWALPLIEAADLIVWLDPPRTVAAWRVMRRGVELHLHGTAPYGWRKTLRIVTEALHPRTFGEVIASPKNLNPSHAAIATVLQPHQDKAVRVHRRCDLRMLIQCVAASAGRAAH